MDRALPRWKFAEGMFAEQLHQTLECLPAHLWHEKRRKRTYVNQVLARSEIDSAYRPVRKLWARTRNGHYLPNPQLMLRKADGWQPVYDALGLDWIDIGCGRDGDVCPRPAAVVARLRPQEPESQVLRTLQPRDESTGAGVQPAEGSSAQHCTDAEGAQAS